MTITNPIDDRYVTNSVAWNFTTDRMTDEEIRSALEKGNELARRAYEESEGTSHFTREDLFFKVD